MNMNTKQTYIFLGCFLCVLFLIIYSWKRFTLEFFQTNRKQLKQPKQLVVFLTHKFTDFHIDTLKKMDRHHKQIDVIVLFDNKFTVPSTVSFKHIPIIPIKKIDTSYDTLGHTLYLHYFKKNSQKLTKYDYIWIIENDVYYPDSFFKFIDIYTKPNYTYDLLVPEYGLREPKWGYLDTLQGFSKKKAIGALCCVCRFSSRFMKYLVQTMDTRYKGYLEAVLPHYCLNTNYTIQTFNSRELGTIGIVPNSITKQIEQDITNGTQEHIENKLYHPIKL